MASEPIQIDLGDEIVRIIPKEGMSVDEALKLAATKDPKIAAYLGKEKAAKPITNISQLSPAEKVGQEFERRKELGPSIGQQILRGGISAAATLPALAMPGGIFPKLAMEVLGPAIAETAMQKTGLAPESGTDIMAAGLTPLATRGVFGLPGLLRGATRGAMEFAAPQTMRETGVEMIKTGGAKSPSADFLFAEARRQGPVPKIPIIDAIQNAITKEEGSLVTPSRGTIAILKDFQQNVWHGPSTGISYDDLIDATQKLRQQAEGNFKRGNNTTGVALLKARAQILDAMDDVSPAIKAANDVYRREESMKAITKEARKANPGTAVRNLFESDEMVAGSFFPSNGRQAALEAIRKGEWEKVPELQKIIDMADRIGRAGTGTTMGAFNRMLMAGFETIAEPSQEPGAKAFLRMLMANPRQPIINRTAASAAGQFGREFLRTGTEPQSMQDFQDQIKAANQ